MVDVLDYLFVDCLSAKLKRTDVNGKSTPVMPLIPRLMSIPDVVVVELNEDWKSQAVV